MSKPERLAYAARGGYCPDSVRFIEDVAHGCHQEDATEDEEVKGNEVTFVIDLTKPLDMAITHPEEDHSHYPAVITKLKPEGQAEQAGVEVGMHIHYINGITCKDMSLKDVMILVSNAKKKASISNVVTTMSMICALPEEEEKEEEEEEDEKKKNKISVSLTERRAKQRELVTTTTVGDSMKELSNIVINEPILRKMFDSYDVDDVGTFSGKELLQWIQESAKFRISVLNLPKLSLKMNEKEIKQEILNESAEERAEDQKITNELGTRILWALAFGMGDGIDKSTHHQDLQDMGDNLSFRHFMKWVRSVVRFTIFLF